MEKMNTESVKFDRQDKLFQYSLDLNQELFGNQN